MLFDETERTETRVKRESESTFSYLNLSARSPMTAARQVLELWFADYPDLGKTDLRASTSQNCALGFNLVTTVALAQPICVVFPFRSHPP